MLGGFKEPAFRVVSEQQYLQERPDRLVPEELKIVKQALLRIKNQPYPEHYAMELRVKISAISIVAAGNTLQVVPVIKIEGAKKDSYEYAIGSNGLLLDSRQDEKGYLLNHDLQKRDFE